MPTLKQKSNWRWLLAAMAAAACGAPALWAQQGGAADTLSVADPWKVQPDPAAPTSSTPPGAGAASEAVAYPLKTPITLAGAPFSTWHLPAVTSRFALLTKGDGFALYDLKPGTIVKQTNNRLPFDNPELSPDGQYVAGYTRGGAHIENRAMVNTPAGVEIWSLRTGTMVSRYAESQGLADLKVVAFTPQNRLIVSQKNGDGSSALVELTPVGAKVMLTAPLPAPWLSCAAFSPGGRYLLTRFKDDRSSVFAMIDLRDGSVAGECSFTPGADRETAAVGFTPDGQHFLISRRKDQQIGITRLSMAACAAEAQGSFERTSVGNPFGGQSLMALRVRPDGKAVLLGNDVLDIDTLKVTAKIDPKTPAELSLWASDTQVLLFGGRESLLTSAPADGQPAEAPATPVANAKGTPDPKKDTTAAPKPAAAAAPKPAAAPTAWAAHDDPPAARPAAAVSASTIKPDFTLHDASPGSWTLAEDSGPFALRANANHFWLWDLHTGKMIHEAAAHVPGRGKLSNDGLFLADVQGQSRYDFAQHREMDDSSATVWSLQSGQQLLHYAPAGVTNLKLLGVTHDTRIVVSQKSGDAAQVAAVPFVGKKPAVTVTLPVNLGEAAALSPGGKYLAVQADVPDHGQLEIIDLAAGTIAGEINLGKWTSQQSISVAYTPDGKHIVVARQNDEKRELSSYAAATGAKEVRLSYDPQEGSVRAGGPRTFRFSPDGKLFTLGHDIYDTATLRLAMHLEAGDKPARELWASPMSLLLFVDDNDHAVVDVKAIKPEELAQSQAELAGTAEVDEDEPGEAGAAQVAAAPPLDYSEAGRLAIVPAGSPSPLPAQPAAVDEKPFAARFPLIPFRSPHHNGLDPGQMVIAETSRTANVVFVQRDSNQIERYDMETGKGTLAGTLPKSLYLLNASMDGTQVLLRPKPANDRLEFWAARDGLLQPRATFAPFPADDATTAPAATKSDAPDARHIASAALLDNDHFIAVSETGTMVVADLRSGKVLWQTRVEGAQNNRVHPQTYALSPNRAVAAIVQNRALMLVDVMTGKGIALALPNKGTPVSWAFAPDGSALGVSAVVAAGHYSEFVNVPLTAAAPAGLTISREAGYPSQIQFLPHDCVLSNEWCYSLRGHGMVARYSLSTNFVWSRDDANVVSVYDRPVRLVMDKPNAKSAAMTDWSLYAVPLPDATVAAAADQLKEADVLALAPGQSVKLNLTVVGDEAYKKSQEQAWQAALAARGFTVSDSATTELRVTNGVTSGAKTTYHLDQGFGGRGRIQPPGAQQPHDQQVTVDFQVPTWRIELYVNGKKAWGIASPPPVHTETDPFISLAVGANETAQQAADRFGKVDQASHVQMPPDYVPMARDVPSMVISPTDITSNGNVEP